MINANNFHYLSSKGITYANRDNVQIDFKNLTALITLKAGRAQNKLGELKDLTRDLEDLALTFKVILCFNKKSFQWLVTKTEDRDLIIKHITELQAKYPLYGYTSELINSKWVRAYDENTIDWPLYVVNCETDQKIQDKLYNLKKEICHGSFTMPRDGKVKDFFCIDWLEKSTQYSETLAESFFRSCDKLNIKYLDFIKQKSKKTDRSISISIDSLPEHTEISQKQLMIADALGFVLPEKHQGIIDARSVQVFNKIGT